MQFTPTEQSLLAHVYANPIPTSIPLEETPPWFQLDDAKALADEGWIQYRSETIEGKRYLVIWRNESRPAKRVVSSFQKPPESEIAFNDDHYQILRYLDRRLARTAQLLERSYLMVDAVVTNKQLGLNRNRITHCLEDLEKAGYVKNNGKRMGWTITELGQTELARYLAMTPDTGSA